MRASWIAFALVGLASGTLMALASCGSSSSPTAGPGVDGSTSTDASTSMDASTSTDASAPTDASIDKFVRSTDAGFDAPSSTESGSVDAPTDAAAEAENDGAHTLGNGTFAAAAIVGLTDGGPTGYSGLVAADFNMDHKLDIAAGGSAGVILALGNGNGTFGPPTLVSDVPMGETLVPAPVTSTLAVIDANSDGKPDIAVGDTLGRMTVLIGKGNGAFDAPAPYTFAGGSYVQGIGVGDFNGDHHPDIATTDMLGLNVFLNTGDAGFGAPTSIALADLPFDVVVTDVNGDQQPDLVLGSSNTNIFVLLGQGGGHFGTAVPYAASPGDFPYAVAVADFTGDRIVDIATANHATHTIGVLAGIGDGGFITPPALVDAGAVNIYGMTMGDYNGDGKPDLALNSETSAQIVVLLNTGSSFAPAKSYPQPTTCTNIITADFNADQKLDLAVFCFDHVTVFLGD